MKYGTVTLGQIEAVWNKLGGEDGVKRLLADQLEITIRSYLINLDADPVLPEGWTVLPEAEQLPNRVRGQFQWDPAKVALHLDPGQENGSWIEGNKLRANLASVPVFGSPLHDYLLEHPELIPDSWRGKAVFFWGTIFRGPGGRLFVRCLRWFGRRWLSRWRWLDYGWGGLHPALCLASSSVL